MFIMQRSKEINISTARFANVAFSDGSLLYGFNQRIQKRQPIVAPNDIKRFFVIPKEAGELCLMSCIFGENREIFFPKLSNTLHLISFVDIAVKYLECIGYEPYLCSSEYMARELVQSLPKKGIWPCFFSVSDTTGEKVFEEFYTEDEIVNMNQYQNLGVIKNKPNFDQDKLECFSQTIQNLKISAEWTKKDLIDLFCYMIPDFGHKETGKYLDSKM